MADNTIEFFTIRTFQFQKKENLYSEDESFYAKNREDAIKKIKNAYNMNSGEKTYCLIYKTIFSEKGENTTKDLDIGAIATSVNLILRHNNYDKVRNTYTLEGKEYIIAKIIQHFSSNAESGTIKSVNPVIVMCKKNDKIYAYEPKSIDINIDDNNIKNFFLKKKKQRDATYKSTEFIEEKLKESEKYFGAFLLEEYIKDELKGLGTKLAEEKIKKLEEEKKKVQQDLLKVNIERLESFIKDQIKITGYKINESKDKTKLLELGAKKLEKEVIDNLKITALELKNNRLEEEIANTSASVDVFHEIPVFFESSLGAGVAKLENFITNQLTNVGKELQIAKLQSYADLFKGFNPVEPNRYTVLSNRGLKFSFK